MTKQELLEQFNDRFGIYEDERIWLSNNINSVIQQAISDHEQGKWQNFTADTLPKEGELIIVQFPPESRYDPIIIRYSQETDNFLNGDMWTPYEPKDE